MTYKQLPDGRWQRQLSETEHKPKEVGAWYMRDDHTFRPLPLDVERAVSALREERDLRNLYGMLCGSPDGVVPAPVHARDLEKWPEFEAEAREWLVKAVRASQPPSAHSGPGQEVELPPPIGWLPRGGVAFLLAKKGAIGAWPSDLGDGSEPVYTREQVRAILRAAAESQAGA